MCNTYKLLTFALYFKHLITLNVKIAANITFKIINSINFGILTGTLEVHLYFNDTIFGCYKIDVIVLPDTQ